MSKPAKDQDTVALERSLGDLKLEDQLQDQSHGSQHQGPLQQHEHSQQGPHPPQGHPQHQGQSQHQGLPQHQELPPHGYPQHQGPPPFGPPPFGLYQFGQPPFGTPQPQYGPVPLGSYQYQAPHLNQGLYHFGPIQQGYEYGYVLPQAFPQPKELQQGQFTLGVGGSGGTAYLHHPFQQHMILPQQGQSTSGGGGSGGTAYPPQAFHQLQVPHQQVHNCVVDPKQCQITPHAFSQPMGQSTSGGGGGGGGDGGGEVTYLSRSFPRYSTPLQQGQSTLGGGGGGGTAYPPQAFSQLKGQHQSSHQFGPQQTDRDQSSRDYKSLTSGHGQSQPYSSGSAEDPSLQGITGSSDERQKLCLECLAPTYGKPRKPCPKDKNLSAHDVKRFDWLMSTSDGFRLIVEHFYKEKQYPDRVCFPYSYGMDCKKFRCYWKHIPLQELDAMCMEDPLLNQMRGKWIKSNF